MKTETSADQKVTISDEYYEPWQDPTHAATYDCWAPITTYELKKIYERFNEFKLLQQYEKEIQGKRFVEIGCATGELYRYLRKYYPRFEYHGFDISKVALERAREKYPSGKFYFSEGMGSVYENLNEKPSFVFSRDVIVHQTKPFQFLKDILQVPSEGLLLRLRTRDKGVTVLDPDISCQWHYNTWAAYMLINIDEFIETVKKSVNFSLMHIVRYYVPLGGYNYSFLPKDCYYPETGTARTAVFIKLSDEKQDEPKIIFEEKEENLVDQDLMEYFFKAVRKVKNKIISTP